jgi:hypothetical protein
MTIRTSHMQIGGIDSSAGFDRPWGPRAAGGRPREAADGAGASRTGEASATGEVNPAGEARRTGDSAEAGATDQPRGPGKPEKLTERDQAKVKELERRDAEVRAHEAAHAAAAGAFGGGASFSYVTGPDGKQYAVGGEVPVRMSGGRTPEEAIRNAAQVRAAALAPAQPSAQDMAVAAEAAAMEASARAELAARRQPEKKGAGDETPRTGLAAAAPAPPPDPADLLQQLETEQRQNRGQWRHLHSEGGCGSCGKAAAAYL